MPGASATRTWWWCRPTWVAWCAPARWPSREGELKPFAGETRIFIFPGYRITSIDGLLTNFHLPESTLLMLVSAFAGHQRTLDAYRHAVEQRYRFFSYGDAMLVWPGPKGRESGIENGE